MLVVAGGEEFRPASHDQSKHGIGTEGPCKPDSLVTVQLKLPPWLRSVASSSKRSGQNDRRRTQSLCNSSESLRRPGPLTSRERMKSLTVASMVARL